MAYIPTTHGTHAWAPVTGSAPPVLYDQGGSGTAAPNSVEWVKINGIQGWRDLPEIVDNRAPRTFGVGEVLYPPRVLGKTVVYLLEARAANDTAVHELVSDIVNGFGQDLMAGTTEEGVMTVTPFEGVTAYTFSGRVIAIDPDDEPKILRGVPLPHRWVLTVSIRMSDPQFYNGPTPTL